jgi:hypothetical protein
MAGIQPDLDRSGHRSGRIWPKWQGSCRILPDPEEFGRNLAKHVRQNSATTTVTFSPSIIFFVRTKHFFLKMISSKAFYDKNHFKSKQTEHKLNYNLHFLQRDLLSENDPKVYIP